MKVRNALLIALVVTFLAGTLFSSSLYATDGVWTKAGSGRVNWSDPASWENGIIANGIGATATFRPDTTWILCNFDTPVTLGHFEFECLGNYVTYRMEDDPWQRVQLATTSGTPSITVNDDATTDFRFPVGGSQGVDKFGVGTLQFSDGNNYTGVTTIHAGVIEAWNSDALGANGTGNETVVLNGGNLTIGPIEALDAAVNEAVTISGPGAQNNSGALRLYGNAEFAGAITLDGDATINQNEAYQKGVGKITGNIALPDGADVTFQMEHYAAPYFTIDNFTTTVSGDISGTGGVFVTSSGTTGKGTLILSGNNTYSGGNTIADETGISVSADVNLGAASNGVVLDNGKLKITGTSYTSTDRTIEIQSGDGTIDIDDASHSFSIASSLTGTGDLIKKGDGKLCLTSNNSSFTQNFRVKGGTLAVGRDNSVSDQTSIILYSGTKLELQGAEDIGSLVGSSDTSVDIHEHNLRFGSDDTDASYGGPITGTGMVGKFGIGTQTLTGNLSYTGNTEVQKGRLFLAGNNEAMTGDILIEEGAALKVAGGNAISSGTRLTMESNTSFTLQDDESIGSLHGDGTVNTRCLRASELSVGQDNTDMTFSGTIIGDGGKLTKLGTGTLTLSGRSTYTGKTTVAEGAIVLNDALAIAGSGTIEIQNGATLRAVYMNSLQDSNHVDVKEGGILDMQAGGAVKSFTGAGTILGHGQTIFAGADNSSFTFEGTLDWVKLAKQGTGTCTIAGDQIQGFDAVVEAGTLRFEKPDINETRGLIEIQSGATVESTNNGIGDYNDVDVAAGATLMLEANETIGSLSGAGSVVLPTPNPVDPSDPNPLPHADLGLNVCSGNNSQTTTFSGTISGDGHLFKTGTHTLVLESENTYTGGTILAQGCIVADHDQVFGTGGLIFDDGELQINEGVTIRNEVDFTTNLGGGVLCGNGTLQNDLITDNYVLMAPGNHPLKSEDSIGLFTIDGNYTQGDETYLFMELGGTGAGDFDVLNITGLATLGGSLYVDLFEGFTPTLGDTFDILDWTAYAAGSQFDSLMLPELTDDDWYWNTSNLYTTGTLSVATTVPEPTTLAMLLTLFVLGTLGHTHFRKNRKAPGR